ncbi:hypothetical protein LI177_02780 [bacterium 210820-DFI.6.37]|nr:hypothetical protein [bacterium 210820-DFI.6.37]
MIELRLKRIEDVQRMYTGDVVLKIVCEKSQNSLLDKLYKMKGKSLKDYALRMLKPPKKRSLDANAYCWVLCRKIAEKLGSTDTEIYKQAIRDYGLTTIRPDKTELVDDLVRMWDSMGLGNSHDILGPSKIEGYTNVKYYYGSSSYNTRQMAHLLDGIIQDAKEQEIETLTPDELQKMKEAWK